MTQAEVLVALKFTEAAYEFLFGLAGTLQREQRDPTPDEETQAKAHQQATTDAWKALLPK